MISSVRWRQSAKKKVELELRSKRIKPPLLGALRTGVDLPSRGYWRKGARLLPIAVRLIQRSGWNGTRFSIEDIFEQTDDMEVVEALFDRPETLDPLKITTISAPSIEEPRPRMAIYTNRLRFGHYHFAYAARITVTTRIKGIARRLRICLVHRRDRVASAAVSRGQDPTPDHQHAAPVRKVDIGVGRVRCMAAGARSNQASDLREL